MANNTWTKSYADGAALTEAKLDAGFQSVQPDLAQTALLTTGASAGQVLTVSSGGAAAVWSTPADYKALGARNYGLAVSTSSGSIIIALKSAAGTNPTASDPVNINFSSSGSSTGLQQNFIQTSSLTLSVTASATLGVLTATTTSIYVYAVRVSSSTLRMGVSSNGALDTGVKRTTVAMSASSDLWATLYSNASVGTYPIKLLASIKASHTGGSWNAIYSINLTDRGTSNTNWISYTPTGTFSANSTYTGKWRRVGDSMHVAANILFSGAPSTANCVIAIPTGFNIDTTKIVGTTTNRPVGFSNVTDFGGVQYGAIVNYSTTTSVGIYAIVVNQTYAFNTPVTATAPFTLGNADTISTEFTVPILEFAF